jgi:hypothetical protein
LEKQLSQQPHDTVPLYELIGCKSRLSTRDVWIAERLASLLKLKPLNAEVHNTFASHLRHDPATVNFDCPFTQTTDRKFDSAGPSVAWGGGEGFTDRKLQLSSMIRQYLHQSLSLKCP